MLARLPIVVTVDEEPLPDYGGTYSEAEFGSEGVEERGDLRLMDWVPTRLRVVLKSGG